MKPKIRTAAVAAMVCGGAVVAGCASTSTSSSSGRPTPNEIRARQAAEDVAFDDLEVVYPNVRQAARSAYAMAIFPRVTKGAAGIGGARGEGLVYRGGELIGSVVLSQVSLGAQLGGSTFRELILFEDERALRRMIVGNMEVSANATAVAGDQGATGAIDYDDGVAVYVVALGGLMLDASIGTQDFDFRYLD